MTRIYFGKLVTLVLLNIVLSANSRAQQWIGVSSQSPSEPTISFSGNTENQAEINIGLSGFYLEETTIGGKTLHSANLAGGHPILLPGTPDVQKLSFTLQLPAKGNLDISIETSNYIDYPAIEILPTAESITRSGIPGQIGANSKINANEFFPGKIIESEHPFIIRNSRAQAFQVYPLQYNPVTHVLRFYYHLNFRMVNSGGEGDNALSPEDLTIQNITGLSSDCINTKAAFKKSGQLPPSNGSLLIICPNEYKSAIKPLAEWRTQTGIKTEIVESETFTGAESLYNFVKEYYYKSGNLAYLLLVGDNRQIPAFMLPYGASDNYFSYLAGNDHYPDILVGRFSAETVQDVEVQVKRTLQYEKEPGTDANWLATATGIASTLSPGDEGESDFQHIRNLLNILKTKTYSKTNEFFEGSQGDGDAEGNPSTSAITDKINQGTGVIFYAGHGSPGSWATGSITKSVVENLGNNGKYPLIWSAACENGNFTDNYCLAEAWLRAANSNGQPVGALAALMSAGTQTSSPPMEAQDKIAELMANPVEELSTMGAISVRGMMSMNDVYGEAGFTTTDTWILFGDPSLKVRTAVPGKITANHKGSIGAGSDSYIVKCNADKGRVCLSDNGSILGTAQLEDGFARVNLDSPLTGNKITMTITSLNFLPYFSEIEVIQIPGEIENCSPQNHSRLQPISTDFSWTSGDGGKPDYYLFYLGTDNPPTNMVNGQIVKDSHLKTGYNFAYNQEYYWRVVPVNSFGKAEGKIMDFNTVFAPDEDFEPVFKSRLKWNDGGMQKWENDGTQFFDGVQSIRSGLISDNQYSSLIYPCVVTNCDFLSFWSKTSCESEDKLQFMVDGITIEEWSGLTDWNFHIYKVEPGTHQIEWRYSKNSSSSAGYDAAWLDNIHLPVHSPATSSVQNSGSVCQGSVFSTSASAQNYFTLSWNTEGDGSFEDNNLETVNYNPGASDIENAETKLHFFMNGFDGCPVTEKILTLTVNPQPVVNLPSDTIISTGNSIELDATVQGNMTYSWQPCGSTCSRVTVDSLLSVNGSKTTSVTITSEFGCSATKEIMLHFNNSLVSDEFEVFPNPSNGNFELKPLKGSSNIKRLTIIDESGKVVWQSDTGYAVYNTLNLSIKGVTKGMYFLLTETDSNRTVNKVIVK